jgi:hypothetical protein
MGDWLCFSVRQDTFIMCLVAAPQESDGGPPAVGGDDRTGDIAGLR